MATHKIAMRIFEHTTDTLSFANFLLNANVKPPTTHPAPRRDDANSPLIWLSDKMRTARRHCQRPNMDSLQPQSRKLQR
jgi:hypothetical protein